VTGTGATAATSDPWDRWLRAIAAGLEVAGKTADIPLPHELIASTLNADGGPDADVAFPVHRVAASAHREPGSVAQALAAAFPSTPTVLPATASGAYVNFSIEPRELVRSTLDLALGQGTAFGHSSGPLPAVCVEHTSANPTGPFHVGRVRNAIIGDTLSRILRASGAPVTTQYYVDDMGRQAALITWIWSKPITDWPEPIRTASEPTAAPDEKPDRRRGRPYPAASAFLKQHPEAAEEVAEVVRTVESGHPPPQHRKLAEEILSGMLASLARLGISFDEFVWESDLLRDGSVGRALQELRRAPHAVREENGAWAIDAATYGLPKESTHVVFERADGTSLYVARDIAYHLQKFARFGRAVDVLGQDHQLHARTLDALLAEVGATRRPEYVIYQDITVPDGGRMSTRGGSAVWLDDLLDEAVERARKEVLARRDDLSPAAVDAIARAVASGAVRFHILRVAPDKPVRFRWEEALSFEGRSGPFIQYAHARASSVLRKGGAEKPPYPFDPAQLVDPEEVGLVRVVSRFPRTVAYAARTAHVHTVAGYAHELADRFNRFYHAVPVLSSGTERASRIALVAAVRTTLANALGLLAVEPLDTM
jgi:arginyl-tRNA synthetase